MQASSRVGRWGHRQALRDKDSSRMENRYEMGGESGPRSVNRPAHTACLGAVWRAVWCNVVRPGAPLMRDEQSGS